MTRLSIIIASSSDAAACEDTLASVLQNRPTDADIWLVHSLPYDDPYGLGEEVNFLQSSRSTIAGRVAVACEQVRGEVVHLLPAGATVTEGWTDAAVAHFAQRGVGEVTPRTMTTGCGFYRRQAVLPFLPELETGDNELFARDLALSLEEAGWQSVVEPSCVPQVTSFPAIQDAPRQHGRAAERMFWRHASGPGAVVGHPFQVLGEAVSRGLGSAAPRLLGHLAGLLEFGLAAKHRRLVDEAADARAAFENETAVLPFPTARSAPRGAVQPAYRRAA